MTLPPRYWVWQTIYGTVFRFDDGEADRINTVLDAHTESDEQPMFITATDISGMEVRLHVAFLDVFHECTTESRAFDNEVCQEIRTENKQWDE